MNQGSTMIYCMLGKSPQLHVDRLGRLLNYNVRRVLEIVSKTLYDLIVFGIDKFVMYLVASAYYTNLSKVKT